jgi:hypothetical protein
MRLLQVVNGELYAVRGKKGWRLGQYNGRDGLRGEHWFTGVLGSGKSVEMETLDGTRVRELSPADKQRFAALEAEYRRAFNEMMKANAHWLDEHRRIQAAAKAICQPRLLVMKPRRG